jgi:hypothetical protein
MIEKLTISKLKASGFNESQIENFKTNPQYEAYHYNKSGCFYASNKEKKIYSGSDATLLVYDKSEKNIPFPYWDKDFIPIYFETKKRLYIKEQKRVSGNNFIEKAANEKFKADEIQCIKNDLNPFQLPERNVLFNIYLNWLYDLDSNLKPKPIRIYYAVKLGNIVNNFGSGEIGLRQYAKSFQGLNDFSFKTEIISTPPEKIPEKLEFHLRSFERNGGEKMDWISHTKDLLPVNITPQQKDSFLCWFENAEAISNNLPPQQTETKTDKLKADLGEYGFFEMPKVKELSEPNKQSLIELISKNLMPYGIAMFDYLGFCEYLDREQGTKYKANYILSKLYNEKAKDGTSAKHYRRSLIKPLPRYKAGEYKQTVKTDYQKLK